METVYQYDDQCGAPTGAEPNYCYKTITLKQDIPAPVYVSYELGNFYQNHRRYVKSRAYEQLMGKEIDMSTANTQCDPVVTNSQMNKTLSVNFTPLDPDAIAYPCGLIAKSLFTDTYELSQSSDSDPLNSFFFEPYTIDSGNIAWKSDVQYKYKN